MAAFDLANPPTDKLCKNFVITKETVKDKSETAEKFLAEKLQYSIDSLKLHNHQSHISHIIGHDNILYSTDSMTSLDE